jgi:hypothetical protein
MQQARHQPLVHDGALESIQAASLWHLALVSASTLLLGEDGKQKRGPRLPDSQQRRGLQSLHHKCSRNRVSGLSWIVPR